MRRLLMATAAVIALAVAAPLATAQYTTPPPATAPYTTPIPDDPNTPQDESLSAEARTTANQTTPQYSTMQQPAPQDPAVASASQRYDAPGQEGVSAAQAQIDATPAQTQVQTYGEAETQTYAARSGMAENVATPASLERHALDAGMDGLPMTPQEVCMTREISLTTRGAALSRDKEHQLINAADRASVCEFQRVVLESPNGRADEARQLLIEHGVDANLIEVRDGDSAGLEVEMIFAGVATSSEQYAQMFNTQQYAGYQPSAAAQPYGVAPSSRAPATTPAPDASSSEGIWMGDPSVQIPQNPTTESVDEGMSRTSGEPAVQPGMLDI